MLQSDPIPINNTEDINLALVYLVNAHCGSQIPGKVPGEGSTRLFSRIGPGTTTTCCNLTAWPSPFFLQFCWHMEHKNPELNNSAWLNDFREHCSCTSRTGNIHPCETKIQGVFLTAPSPLKVSDYIENPIKKFQVS